MIDNERSRCIVHVIWFFYEIHFAISKILSMLHNFIILSWFFFELDKGKVISTWWTIHVWIFFKNNVYNNLVETFDYTYAQIMECNSCIQHEYMLLLDMSTKNFKLYVNSLHIYIKIKFHHHFNRILLCSPCTPLHKPSQNYCILLKFKCGLETNGFDLSWFNLHCYPHHLAPYYIHANLILNMTLISFTLF